MGGVAEIYMWPRTIWPSLVITILNLTLETGEAGDCERALSASHRDSGYRNIIDTTIEDKVARFDGINQSTKCFLP